MKKIRWREFKLRQVDINEIDDRLLLINLYITQGATLLLGLVILLLERVNLASLLAFTNLMDAALWGAGLAAAVLAVDMIISKWVPDSVTDDGGVNERIFKGRALWHIVVLSAIVAFCEEMLFRGAVQHAWGPYWTSILFAAIHVRYLKHWLMTGLVFGISYGLGWVYNVTGTIWCPILAHFLIDLSMGMILRFRKDVE